MIQPTKDIPETSQIEIVATLKTKTVSGKSNLTYHLGKDDDANAHVRIWVNSSNGYFSNEWVSLTDIIDLLVKQAGDSFTSFVFEELFGGKSVNTPGANRSPTARQGLRETITSPANEPLPTKRFVVGVFTGEE